MPADRIAIPNLGMIVPTERNVWINLRLMVCFVSMMKLIGYPGGTRVFWNCPVGKTFTRDLQPYVPPNANISLQLSNP